MVWEQQGNRDGPSDAGGAAPTTSALPGASAAQASPGATALIRMFMHFNRFFRSMKTIYNISYYIFLILQN